MTMPPANEPIETAAGDRPPITIAKALEEVEQLEAAIDTEEGDEAEEDEGLVDRPSRALGLAEMPPSLLIALRALLDKQAQQLAVFNTEP
ncbi:MAG TPA: hypothetical protein VEI97_08530, partial [bacterium]|nr:hypothetical protein [bacterium]